MDISKQELLTTAREALPWLGLFAVSMYLIASYERAPVADVAPAAEQPRPALGVSCLDGKAWYTSMQSGISQMSALVVDGHFVECGMTYKVDGKEISALDVLQHATNN